MFKEKLVWFIKEIIKDKKNIEISDEESEKVIKNPPDSSFGDYSVASYYLTKYGFKGKPEEIAEEIFSLSMQGFTKIKNFFDKIEVKGPYVNFFVNRKKFIFLTIKSILEAKSDYGRGYPEKPLKVAIDFSSPNIAKPFGVGHLRSTAIGMSLSKIYEFCGHKVIKINYLGDFGTQFGKLITAFCRYGDIDFSEFENDPIKVLYGLYVRIHKDEQVDNTVEEEAKKRFKMLEDFMSLNKRSFEDYLNCKSNDTNETNNEAANEEGGGYEVNSKLLKTNKKVLCETQEGQFKLWKYFRKLSIEEFKRLYGSIGVEFDEYEGEAASAEFASDVKEILLESGIAKISEGAVIVEVKGITVPALIAKADGTSLYLSRDIVTAISRMAKYNYDKMIYVVGSEQSLHFNQLFGIFQMLKEKEALNKIKEEGNAGFKKYASMPGGRLIHVKFGRIIGMSTRKGNLVFLNDYIEEAKLKAKEKLMEGSAPGGAKYGDDEIESASFKIGLGAVIFNDLKTRRTTDVNFNWDNVLSFEGQTGPYLQYSVSRINSLLAKLKLYDEKLNFENFEEINQADEISFKIFPEDVDFNDIFLIARQISSFKEVLSDAMEQNEPSVLSLYILELASLFNKYYQNYRLIGSDIDYIRPRFFMLLAVRILLVRILDLLCIPVLERM